MLYIERPEDFNPKFEVTSCFLEHEGSVLLLHRQDNKIYGDTWGVPAGKLEQGETSLQGVIREIKEEVGYSSVPENLIFFKDVYVRYPEFDFKYSIYYSKLEEKPHIKLNNEEHKDFIWVNPEHAVNMNLIPDEDVCIKLFYQLK